MVDKLKTANDLDPLTIIEANSWGQLQGQAAHDDLARSVIADVESKKRGKDQLRQFFSGKDSVFDYIFGQAMHRCQGKANVALLRPALHTALQEVASRYADENNKKTSTTSTGGPGPV